MQSRPEGFTTTSLSGSELCALCAFTSKELRSRAAAFLTASSSRVFCVCVIKPLLYVTFNDIVITTGEVVSEVSLIAGLLDSTIGQAGTAPPENYNNQNSRPEGNPRNPLSEGPPPPPERCDATISSC